MKRQVVLRVKKSYPVHKRIENYVKLIIRADLMKRDFQRLQVFNPSALGEELFIAPTVRLLKLGFEHCH